MDRVIEGFLDRNLPKFKDKIEINIVQDSIERYQVTAHDDMLYIQATTYIAAFNGLYDYLKKYLHVQLSWCGNRTIDIDNLVMFDGVMDKTIKQKYRVYMNYCTLSYSMAWWDFARWEKEIDFMALNGINMPLCVVGSEAVWYKTMLDMGCSKDEALSTVSGPAFMAWHLMTNIDSYISPKDERYVYKRLELGKKIISRCVEMGMYPIEQGFSGHVPLILKDKFKRAKIIKKYGWNMFPKTGQLDPLDPLFKEIGMKYLSNMRDMLGNYHFIACDPFHEGCPPKPWKWYLRKVGKAIDELYAEFDKDSIWVMQGWTPRKEIIKAVPKDRLLILDLSSDRYSRYDNFYGYEVVSGMLHNFGGKNAMQGKIRRHADNAYLRLLHDGVNVVGTGMFMEGIDQNPVVYDLQFKMLTESKKVDFDAWLSDYLIRRYGMSDDNIVSAWRILMDTCYRDSGYEENEVGSTIAARPQIDVVRAGPCCLVKPWYDTKRLEDAVQLMLSASDKFALCSGYQYDLCDLTRQVLSNRFHDMELEFDKAYKANDIDKVKEIASSQLELLVDIDELLSHRSEMCLSRWICDAKALGDDEDEANYYELNARALITMWGDIDGSSALLHDYSWREWSGLIKEYYYVRWQMFYDAIIDSMAKGEKLKHDKCDDYVLRCKYRSTPFNENLYQFEQSFVRSHKTYEYPVDTDIIPSCTKYIKKYL